MCVCGGVPGGDAGGRRTSRMIRLASFRFAFGVLASTPMFISVVMPAPGNFSCTRSGILARPCFLMLRFARSLTTIDAFDNARRSIALIAFFTASRSKK